MKALVQDLLTNIRLMAEEQEPQKIAHHENLVLAKVLGYIEFFSIFFAIPLSIYWGFSPLYIGVFLVSVLSGVVVLFGIPRIKMDEFKKKHIIGLVLSVQFIINYFIFYDYITTILWMVMVIFALPTAISVSATILGYLVLTSAFVSILIYFRVIPDIIHIETTHRFTTNIMVVFIFIILILANKIYNSMINHKNNQFMNLLEQKKELKELYEKANFSEEELVQKNEELDHLAHTDILTTLPNRRKAHMILDDLIKEGNDEQIYLVCTDLDNFKKINDTLGHSMGDKLLIAVSERFKTCIGPEDFLCSLGGDEFALIMRNQKEHIDVYNYLRAILDIIIQPFKIDNYEMTVSASMGVSIWPSDCDNTLDLMKNANIAMHSAKLRGRNDIFFYESEHENSLLERIQLENNLTTALDYDELYMVYQPIIDGATKEPVAFEALMRWKPTHIPPVGPDVFIPLMEDLGIIHKIGLWAFQEVCNKIKELKEAYNKDIKFFINISPTQLKKNTYIYDLKNIIESMEIDPSLLCFEITESVFIDNLENALRTIYALKELGISIAIDDFGTGYSSLSYLINLPVDVLKIDKSFIDLIDSPNDSDKKISLAIMNMASSLNLRVIAEGVETESQYDFLNSKNCDMIQGYYFSKPMNRQDMKLYCDDNWPRQS